MFKYLPTLLFPMWLLSPSLQADAPISEEAPHKVNYPANFQVAEGVDLFLFGDYLYWGVEEDGLYYAQGSNLKQIDPGYDQGLKAGLGLNFPKSGYEIDLSWTWFA